MTFAELPDFGSLIISPRTEGTICHDTPNLSLSQPHGCCSPPSDRRSHNRSISSCVSQLTKREVPCANVKVRAAVHGHESRSVEFERRVQHLPLRDRTSRLPADHADDAGVLKDRDIALDGFLGLIVERQERGDLLRGVLLPALPRLPVVGHACVSLRFPARAFCRRLSSAPNLSRRASHRPRYCRIHLSSSRNGSAHNE